MGNSFLDRKKLLSAFDGLIRFRGIQFHEVELLVANGTMCLTAGNQDTLYRSILPWHDNGTEMNLMLSGNNLYKTYDTLKACKHKQVSVAINTDGLTVLNRTLGVTNDPCIKWERFITKAPDSGLLKIDAKNLIRVRNLLRSYRYFSDGESPCVHISFDPDKIIIHRDESFSGVFRALVTQYNKLADKKCIPTFRFRLSDLEKCFKFMQSDVTINYAKHIVTFKTVDTLVILCDKRIN